MITAETLIAQHLAHHANLDPDTRRELAGLAQVLDGVELDMGAELHVRHRLHDKPAQLAELTAFALAVRAGIR